MQYKQITHTDAEVFQCHFHTLGRRLAGRPVTQQQQLSASDAVML